MSPSVLLSFIIGYFLVLILISYLTSKKSHDNETFFYCQPFIKMVSRCFWYDRYRAQRCNFYFCSG